MGNSDASSPKNGYVSKIHAASEIYGYNRKYTGAISSQVIASSSSSPQGVSFKTNQKDGASRPTYVGLTSEGVGHDNCFIDFAIEISGARSLSIYERCSKADGLADKSRWGGNFELADGQNARDDVFKVEVVNNAVQYIRNDVVFYTSSRTPSYPLRVATSLQYVGAAVSDVMVYSAAPSPIGSCLACPAGKYSRYIMLPSGPSTSCTPCPGGKYSSDPSSLSCSTCPVGKFSGPNTARVGGGQDHTDWSRTRVHGSNYHVPTALTGAQQCWVCKGSTYSSASKASCIACTANEYSTGVACAPCPEGTQIQMNDAERGKKFCKKKPVRSIPHA
jgi:hypothetical protein